MTQQSNRLQKVPIIQKKPKSDREWNQFINEMAKWVIDVTKAGQLPNQDVLNTITIFNKGSSQSALPLTAADVGSDTTITIASHNVHFDGNTLAYNSGTITGLGFSTKYYIYADDATRAGGAVTYVSSTTSTDMVASADRYYVGAITTPADGGGGTSGGGGGGAGGEPDNGGVWP